MAVLREFRCAAHGPFESKYAECPHGCSPRFVTQEFRTAPNTMSRGVKNADRQLDLLAKDYRLTDLKNGKDGESVMTTLRKNPSFTPSWGKVQHAKSGFSQRGEQAKTFDPTSMGVQRENNFAQVKPLLGAPRPAFVNKPG
jgi:hypothetical protein